jgi:uncharacterized protein (UPF0261 family)
MISGVLDVTTTEWADELVGGTLTAGPTRMDAAAKMGLPTVIVPGCVDMVNFGEPATVPAKFLGRNFYHHNPQVTLMRTDAHECAELGRILAQKANAHAEPPTVLLPLKGVSILSKDGGPFFDVRADDALFSSINAGLRANVPCVEMDCDINDPSFAASCVNALLQQIEQRKNRA